MGERQRRPSSSLVLGARKTCFVCFRHCGALNTGARLKRCHCSGWKRLYLILFLNGCARRKMRWAGVSDGNISSLFFFSGRLCLQQVVCGTICASSILAAGTRSAEAKTGGEVNHSARISLFAPSAAEELRGDFVGNQICFHMYFLPRWSAMQRHLAGKE